MDEHASAADVRAPSGVACFSCGYNLVGVRIGDPCPECGTAVNQFGTSNQTQGKAVASMVLGIVSLVTCMAYGVIGMPRAILAIVYAKKARLAVQAGAAPVTSLGMATAGRVCGWIGVVLNGIGLTFLLFYLAILLVAVVGGAAAASGGVGP